MVGRRLQVQERIGQDIADIMADYKIGQILTSTEDVEIEKALSGEKVKIPKVAEWVKRMKAYKAAQLQDMAK